MHVGDVAGWADSGRNWNAYARVYVEDAAHSPVSGATVDGSWSTGGSSSCVTDSRGSCVMNRTVNRKSGNTTVFTVDSVSHASMSYDGAANHDPEADYSNGGTPTISIDKGQAAPTPTPSGEEPTPTPVPSETATEEPTATSAPSGYLHVGNLVGWAGGGRNWQASVRAYVEDASHDPVSGATVNGTWSTGGGTSCVTDSSGTCVMNRTVSGKSGSTTVFAVDSITYASLEYAASANHDPEGDFAGGGTASISIDKSQSAPTPTPSGEEPTPTPVPSETATVEPTIVPSGGADSIHVIDLDASKSASGPNWTATVRIEINDGLGERVAGVTVEGHFDNDSVVRTCVTDDNGRCSISSEPLCKKSFDSVVFSIDSLAKDGLNYVAADNNDSDGEQRRHGHYGHQAVAQPSRSGGVATMTAPKRTLPDMYDSSEYVSLPTLASELGVERSTILKWLRFGLSPAYESKTAAGTIRLFARKDVRQFLEDQGSG